MRWRWTALLPAMGLGACGQGAVGGGAASFCERVAAADPAVKALVLRGVSDPSFIPRQGYEVAEARERARLDCLRRQGLPPQGEGVAPLPRTGTLFP